jgi:hypothetical protein
MKQRKEKKEKRKRRKKKKKKKLEGESARFSFLPQDICEITSPKREQALFSVQTNEAI